MTKGELMKELEGLPDDFKIRIAKQPDSKYSDEPIWCEVDGAVVANDEGELSGEPFALYLREGEQGGFASRDLWEV